MNSVAHPNGDITLDGHARIARCARDPFAGPAGNGDEDQDQRDDRGKAFSCQRNEVLPPQRLVPILSTDISPKPVSNARYDADMPVDPAEVWKLVQRADELVKYAQNRDPALAYAQARGVLDEAEALATQRKGQAA